MDTSYEHLKCDIHDQVAQVTIDNAAEANKLTAPLAKELVNLLHCIEESDVRAIVLTGTDGYFSAGADISSFDMSSADAVRGDLFGKVNPYDVIENLNQPVIAAVNGSAFAGGLELVLVCDLVVVANDVQLGFPEATLGIIPGVAMLRLTEQLGKHQALELMLTGEPITGSEAVEQGLFNYAVPHEEVQSMATDLAETVADNAPVSASIIKKVVNCEHGGDYAINDLALGTVFGTEDIRRGKRAFLNDKEASFEGE